MTTRFIILTLVLLSTFLVIFGQIVPQSEPNYDENKVPKFELPDPLTTFSGKKIKTPGEWIEERRPELLAFFSENVYGKVPCKIPVHQWEVVEQSSNALDGKACRKQVDLIFKKDNHALRFTILMYLPKGVEKAPLFLGYNFYGNHTIINDPNVLISNAWTQNNESLGIANHQLTEASRGVRANRWPVEKIIHAGYGLATIFYCEVDPDRDDFSDGIHPFCYVKEQQIPAADEWGSISAWAWGLSRAMDYFEQDKDVDASKVIVFGHSRLGKTALWAGAQDERFSAVISNNSGCGGTALSKRRFGETIARINTAFPHWFCKNFNKYNDNEDALPVDQHELIALIAPRPVYVASAEKDLWADPRGEFLGAYFATPVYELFGKKGIPSQDMPPVNQPIHNTVAYHIRSGEHDVTDFDWEQYIKWADKQLLNK
ncbi:MAG: acetylxylan esterase [Petrimonas sp.]|nr:acetylxylan esterase [Petrimonas sp.]